MPPAATQDPDVASSPQTKANGEQSSSNFAVGGELAIPGDAQDGTVNAVEVPATRSAMADTSAYMHNLSFRLR
ncbi:hypothetical protein P3342_012637 [Pyrenophora teres f. teres]|nr:hypothetical protein P3342_012637 [Pyrenophora teres f. teres]